MTVSATQAGFQGNTLAGKIWENYLSLILKVEFVVPFFVSSSSKVWTYMMFMTIHQFANLYFETLTVTICTKYDWKQLIIVLRISNYE